MTNATGTTYYGYYIDDVIKANETYDPNLNLTQGAKLRELIKLLRDGLGQNSGGSNSHTYEELKSLVDSSVLVPGQEYILTDYNTQYKQPVSGIIKKDAPNEVLILTAATVNTFYQSVKSPAFPKDHIEYDFNRSFVPATQGLYNFAYRQPAGIAGMPDPTPTIYYSIVSAVDSDLVGLVGISSTPVNLYYGGQLPDTFVPWKVVLWCIADHYTGPAFRLKINNDVFIINPADIPLNISNDDSSYRTLGLQIATGNGGCIVQPFTIDGEVPGDVTDLPPETPTAPEFTRPGWITRRIDDNFNDTPLDHRNILTWKELTPRVLAQCHLYIRPWEVNRFVTDPAPYQDGYICIEHYLKGRIALQTQELSGKDAAGSRTLYRFPPELNIYAIGKCAVETYCLINGTQYTIPPFDNKEYDINLGLVTPIATVSSGQDIRIYGFINPGEVPETADSFQFSSAGVAPVMGPGLIINDGCKNNYIERVDDVEIPQISLENGCNNNSIRSNSNFVFLKSGSHDNLLQNSSISSSQTVYGANIGTVVNAMIKDSQVIVEDSNTADDIAGCNPIHLLGGGKNRANGCLDSFIAGGYCTVVSMDNFQVIGIWNKLNGGGDLSFNDDSAAFVFGDRNELNGYVSSILVRGSLNKINASASLSDPDYDMTQEDQYIHVIGFRNEVNIRKNCQIYGDRNIINYARKLNFDGDGNYFDSRCQGIITGKGFNDNKLENINGTTFGKNCVDNYLKDQTNQTYGDNYSHHSPWSGS